MAVSWSCPRKAPAFSPSPSRVLKGRAVVSRPEARAEPEASRSTVPVLALS